MLLSKDRAIRRLKMSQGPSLELCREINDNIRKMRRSWQGQSAQKSLKWEPMKCPRLFRMVQMGMQIAGDKDDVTVDVVIWVTCWFDWQKCRDVHPACRKLFSIEKEPLIKRSCTKASFTLSNFSTLWSLLLVTLYIMILIKSQPMSESMPKPMSIPETLTILMSMFVSKPKPKPPSLSLTPFKA